MFRLLAILAIALIVLMGAVTGYVAGSQTNHRGWDAADREAVGRTVRAFYAALGADSNPEATEELASLLGPEFVERRIEVGMTLDRSAFLQAVVQQRRAFPGQQLVPIQLESDGNWAMVMLQTVETEPGQFVSITLPGPSTIRREMIEVVDGKIVERIVLAGLGSDLRASLAARIGFSGVGMQTISVIRADFAPHALEQTVFEGPAFLVVAGGALEIGAKGAAGSSFQMGDTYVLSAAGTVEIENISSDHAQLLALVVASAETPRSDPASMELSDATLGVTVQRVAQSTPFLPNAQCFSVHAGRAVLPPGGRLPAHAAGGFEIVVPMSGALEAASADRTFLRTNSERSWQDETGFARLEDGITLTAPPGAHLSYTAVGDAPAHFWLFAVEFDDQPCASGT